MDEETKCTDTQTSTGLTKRQTLAVSLSIVAGIALLMAASALLALMLH